MTVSLKAGGNYVVYTGKVQTAEAAFASIASYVTVVYYYNNATSFYEIPTTMVPYGVYWIEVTQACTWTYGAEATAPSSVQLYEGWNLVGWPGQAISVADAFASIAAYVARVYYYNNATGLYEVPTTMVHNGVYWVAVYAGCIWTFVAPAVVPCEITITAPNSAQESGTVNVSVKIKNVSAYNYSYKATIYAVPDLYPDYIIGSIDQVITSGSSVIRSASFTMPDCDVTIFIWVERWAFDHWVYDNSTSKVVSLEVVPELAGSIIRKELEYSGSGDGTVPVSNVPQGVSAKLHVWGRNDMGIPQGMGIYWFVADPDGLIAEEYSDWGGTIGAGKDHEFISSGSFNLNKVGKYTTWIDLLMGSQDNPVVIYSARYIGDLCTVKAELEAEFSQLKILSFEKK